MEMDNTPKMDNIEGGINTDIDDGLFEQIELESGVNVTKNDPNLKVDPMPQINVYPQQQQSNVMNYKNVESIPYSMQSMSSNPQPQTINIINPEKDKNGNSKCLMLLVIIFIFITLANTMAIGFLFYNNAVNSGMYIYCDIRIYVENVSYF